MLDNFLHRNVYLLIHDQFLDLRADAFEFEFDRSSPFDLVYLDQMQPIS